MSTSATDIGLRNTPSRFRVALVDDHEVIASALRAATRLAPEIDFAAWAQTVDGLLGRSTAPLDLVLLDLHLRDRTSPELNVRRLTEAEHRVLIYTSGESRFLLRSATRTPALGILRKSEPVPRLVQAIQQAARGRPVVTSEWATALQNDPLLADAGITAHEQLVLMRFADGASAHAVARELEVAMSTIEDYVRRIRAKYARVGRHAATKVDLYKRAIEDGFLPAPVDF
jgi:two-component system, NarL family, response regulator DevR